MKAYLKAGLVLGITSCLVACGGDDNIPNGSDAIDITENNVLSMAVAATEGLKKSIEVYRLPMEVPWQKAARSTLVTTNSDSCLDYDAAAGLGGTLGQGEITTIFDDEQTVFSIVFDCANATGSIESTFNPSYSIWTLMTTRWVGFEFLSQDTVDGNVRCERSFGGSNILSPDDSLACVYEYEDVTGNVGDSFAVFDVKIKQVGDGYDVLAIITSEGQKFNLDAMGISFASCGYGVPRNGTVTISSGGTSATVVYNDCDSLTLEYSSTTTYNWSDIFN